MAGVRADRELTHCPRCGAVEPAAGFDRSEADLTGNTAYRCHDCDSRFDWRCSPNTAECDHGPFRWAGDRFVIYFGRGAASVRPDDPSSNGRVAYRADLELASYNALRAFLTATSDTLVGSGEAETVQSKLESAGGVRWPCVVVFQFEHNEWVSYRETHPQEATALEPHLVPVG